MNSAEIRKAFLDFFKSKGHTIVSSSSLIPAEDPTILFANAGMNQFKDLFLGKERRSYTRAASLQKCVRAGGKHNDLDAVGFTSRHLTFFEMMGNFSFGDYFKREAIEYAWEFLTKKMHFPAERLYASVYYQDDESYDFWHNVIGLPAERIKRCGDDTNFWAMGDTGPCGPCTEIHFDRGEQYGCGKPECGVNCDHCSRILEVWNLVFMQYNRKADGTLEKLSQTGVDTGMGFERLCMISQGKDSIFHIDIFELLIKKIEHLTKRSYAQSDEAMKAAFHVLCDHVRSASFIMADGGTPSNEGRGYVLRKIIRRAALFAQKLSARADLLPLLAHECIIVMSPFYSELAKSESLIIKVITQEVERFAVNLTQGQAILDKYLAEQRAKKRTEVAGEQVFKLYDTYGFPPELTMVIAHENAFTIDRDGFEREMKKQQEQSGRKSLQEVQELAVPASISTKFIGYDIVENVSPILYVQPAEEAVWVVTQESPFYVESGGQVNDEGWVTINDHTYKVLDLKKISRSFHNQAIVVKLALDDSRYLERIRVGDRAHSAVDLYKRMNAVRNHTATHMLQAALIQVLGPQVKQAGSVVHPDYLRFDYTNPEPLNAGQIAQIECLMNEKIQEDIHTKIFHTSLEEAKAEGVIAFFGEKYNPENVRVVTIPGFSAELCGGTHAPSTGIIGAFKIMSDSALATGTRRIVALTGPRALELFQQTFNTVKSLGEAYKVKLEQVIGAVEKQQQMLSEAERQIKQLKKQLLLNKIPELQQQIDRTGIVPFLFLELEDISIEDMKQMCTELERTMPGFYFLVSYKDVQKSQAQFMGYVSKQFAKDFDLKQCAQLLSQKYNLRGGGSSTLIQGGGIVTSQVHAAIKELLRRG